ncbi:hypothetical protein MKW92_035540 [Papaver armeniacum]|nr:hypothetical protein MKW92_035540 [Papaver armeniacum]
MERADREEVLVEISEDIINNIERLPEGCISDILSLTTPADVCTSSLVSTLFKSAADSDALWEKFLPPDYEKIISRASNPISSAALSKKELYYRLSDDPLLIDGGLKSFQLEKSSGKKCIMLGAKELAIALGDNPQHWGNVTLAPGLLCLPSGKVIGDAYGFDCEPIKAKVEVVGRADGDTSVCSQERLIYFDVGGEHSPPDPVFEGQYIARKREDGWMEVELGHFYNEGGDSEGREVHMSVLEIGRTKGGLIVQDALWEKFLPANYQDIISRALFPFPSAAATSKKELYYRLCDDPIRIDSGYTRFHLQKSSGRKCIMLGAMDLGIAWRNNPNHWDWIGYTGSRFPNVAELQWLFWLEILYLVLHLRASAYGFGNQPVMARVEVVGRAAGSNSMCSEERHICLSPNCSQGQYFSRERRDGWMDGG